MTMQGVLNEVTGTLTQQAKQLSNHAVLNKYFQQVYNTAVQHNTRTVLASDREI